MSTISNKEETWPLPVEWDRKPLGVILKALSSMESLATRIPESYTVSSSKKTWDSFTNFQKRKILKCWHKCPEDKKRQVMNITSQNTTVLPPYDDFNSDDFARLIHMNVDSKFADILRRIADSQKQSAEPTDPWEDLAKQFNDYENNVYQNCMYVVNEGVKVLHDAYKCLRRDNLSLLMSWNPCNPNRSPRTGKDLKVRLESLISQYSTISSLWRSKTGSRVLFFESHCGTNLKLIYCSIVWGDNLDCNMPEGACVDSGIRSQPGTQITPVISSNSNNKRAHDLETDAISSLSAVPTPIKKKKTVESSIEMTGDDFTRAFMESEMNQQYTLLLMSLAECNDARVRKGAWREMGRIIRKNNRDPDANLDFLKYLDEDEENEVEKTP